ncbi:MAG: hypothetical protein IT539_12720 [Bradyrhizobiaceae bacterium]|nr:hypothetical protein [Bradyrhizobiaceae bacterium]
MAVLDWAPLAGVDFARLHEARLQAHYAVQWLARAARAYLPPSPDDSHTNLGWDDAFDGFETHKLQGARIGLRLVPLALAILEGKETTPSRLFALDGHNEADARSWLGEELGHLGLDARKLDVQLPYKLPLHKIASGAPYAAGTVADAMRELAAWYSNANRSLGRVREAAMARKLDASLVRCWPHHFDIATLISLDKNSTAVKSARSVGIGLSPGDEHINEPYFYVTPWPYPPAAKLPPVPELGHWLTQNFTAAVAPAHRVLAVPGRQTKTEEFLAAAMEASLKALG